MTSGLEFQFSHDSLAEQFTSLVPCTHPYPAGGIQLLPPQGALLSHLLPVESSQQSTASWLCCSCGICLAVRSFEIKLQSCHLLARLQFPYLW